LLCLTPWPGNLGGVQSFQGQRASTTLKTLRVQLITLLWTGMTLCSRRPEKDGSGLALAWHAGLWRGGLPLSAAKNYLQKPHQGRLVAQGSLERGGIQVTRDSCLSPRGCEAELYHRRLVQSLSTLPCGLSCALGIAD
jgi:hypothetical protein